MFVYFLLGHLLILYIENVFMTGVSRDSAFLGFLCLVTTLSRSDEGWETHQLGSGSGTQISSPGIFA